MKKLLFILSILVLFGSCKSRQELPVAAAPVEIKVPLWVSSRPNNGFKYIGIGFAEKSRGADYQMAAKKETNMVSPSITYVLSP